MSRQAIFTPFRLPPNDRKESSILLEFPNAFGVRAEDLDPHGFKKIVFRGGLGHELVFHGAVDVLELFVDGVELVEEVHGVGEFVGDGVFEDGDQVEEEFLEGATGLLGVG